MKELPVLRKARSITSKDRPSPRKLITERNVRDLTLTGIAIGGLLAGMICVNSSPTSEVTPTPIVPETVPATQPVIHETPTNIPTEQSAERGAPYPQNKDISPFTMDSEEAYRQETERTVDELILFFNSKGSDGQAEYDFLVQRLYQRLAFDVIRTVNGGAGGEGFDEEIRNSVFPDSKNFFEARINSRSWALVPRDNDGNFWVPGELNADGNFTAYLGLVPPKYITIDDFEMRKVQTPKGTTAHLFTHPSTHIIIEFYDNQTGQLASWWSAADGLIHRIQAPTSTVTPTPTRTPTPTPTETPTPAPTEAQNPYANFNPVDESTYTPGMIDFYQKLPDIVLNGATEADKVLEEKAHLDFTKGLIDFLGRQGIDTLVWENFTEADLLGYDKAIEIHQAFWQWQLENYSKTGEYQMSSIDTWLDRQMETNIKNYLVSYVDSQGKLNYGIQSDYGPSIEILLNLGNGDINKGLDEWIRQDSNLHSITIPLFGQEALVPTALRGTATGVAFAFQKNPVFPSGSMMSAKVGFITPDGRWVFLPVNIPLNRIPATSQDLIVRNGHEVTPFDEGWVLGPAGESEDGRPSRIDFDKPEDLYRYLGHVIKIFMRNLIRSTDNSSFSSAGGVISRDGMNIVEGIGDLGLTPELSLPLSPLPTSIPATLSPPKIITPSPKDT